MKSVHRLGIIVSPVILPRVSRIAFYCIFCAVILVIPITSCRKAAPIQIAAARQEAKPQVADSRALTPEEPSCRVFVQNFYDMYWNQFANESGDPSASGKAYSYDDALRRNPPVLSEELIRLIKKDEDTSKAAGGDIVNLDFDPFLDSNGPVGKYLVKSASVVNGVCQAAIEGGHGIHEVAELKKSGSSWQFINFHYSHYSEDGKTREFPDDDLIHILNR